MTPSPNQRSILGADTSFLAGTAKPGPYATQLPLVDEQDFQRWVKDNKVPWRDEPKADYDMRGFWRAAQNRDPRAVTSVNPTDNRIHFPDVWKTPYHETFSNESQYATKNAPVWTGDDHRGWKLIDKVGRVINDDRTLGQKLVGATWDGSGN